MSEEKKKYLISTDGVDLSNDAEIDEFARRVWEAFMKANGEENNDTTKEQ